MNTITRILLPLLLLLSLQLVYGQEDTSAEIESLRARRERVTQQEKEALKEEVLAIDERLEAGEITEREAQQLKEEAARKRAMNIEDRRAIFDREIALLERNNGEVLRLEDSLHYDQRLRVGWGKRDRDGSVIFGIRFDERDWDRKPKYDRRTYSDLVVAVGFNNVITEGQSLEESPYKLAGSRFFELGWAWRTRVFRNSNWLRFNYGLSFQFNGLKPEENQYFVSENGQTVLQDFEYELDKSKFRVDNLVIPVHLEFGPSRYREYPDHFRYSLDRQFRMGLGGYAGFNLGARQKLKYTRDGERVKDKLKRGYNTTDLVYGLSAYAGVEGVLLYLKYDLNPIFENAQTEQRNISLGLRFDL